jgi:hypothetical protein
MPISPDQSVLRPVRRLLPVQRLRLEQVHTSPIAQDRPYSEETCSTRPPGCTDLQESQSGSK